MVTVDGGPHPFDQIKLKYDDEGGREKPCVQKLLLIKLQKTLNTKKENNQFFFCRGGVGFLANL